MLPVGMDELKIMTLLIFGWVCGIAICTRREFLIAGLLHSSIMYMNVCSLTLLLYHAPHLLVSRDDHPGVQYTYIRWHTLQTLFIERFSNAFSQSHHHN